MAVPVRKTYKREVAIMCLIAMYSFISYTLYTLAELKQTEAMVDLVGILVIPTFATVAAAFGIDSFFKQNPNNTASKDKDTDK